MRLSSKLLKQGYLVERLKSSFRKFYGRYGDLIPQYEVSLSRVLNDILTHDQKGLLNRSDFLPISWLWCRAWPSPNYEWFPWSICNGCGMPKGNAYPSGHLVPYLFLGTCLCSNCWGQIPRTCQVLLNFSPWIPLGTFFILPLKICTMAISLNVTLFELLFFIFPSALHFYRFRLLRNRYL